MSTVTTPLNDGAKLPGVGFGTWQIVPGFRAEKAVAAALKVGYRSIDTARIYGNERGVGKAILASGIDRRQLFITTKLWNSDQGYESAFKAFDASLKRLNLDYVDLYLLHWPVSGKRLESWRALEEIQASGRARSIGVSNFTVRHLKELLKSAKVVPAVNQIELHPFLYDAQRPIVEYCGAHDIVVEAYSPLAHGHRIDDPVLQEVAKAHHKTPAQVMLRWAIDIGGVPIPKSTHQERITENFALFDFTLSPDEVAQIAALSDNTRTCWDPTEMA